MKIFSKCLSDWIEKYPTRSSARAILEYLRDNAMGSEMAKSWNKIRSHLASKNLVCTKEWFQQNLLKESRNGNLFIGSTDRGVAKGYFIIRNRADVEVMVEFYQRRINVEKSHLDHIYNLIGACPLG